MVSFLQLLVHLARAPQYIPSRSLSLRCWAFLSEVSSVGKGLWLINPRELSTGGKNPIPGSVA